MIHIRPYPRQLFSLAIRGRLPLSTPCQIAQTRAWSTLSRPKTPAPPTNTLGAARSRTNCSKSSGDSGPSEIPIDSTTTVVNIPRCHAVAPSSRKQCKNATSYGHYYCHHHRGETDTRCHAIAHNSGKRCKLTSEKGVDLCKYHMSTPSNPRCRAIDDATGKRCIRYSLDGCEHCRVHTTTHSTKSKPRCAATCTSNGKQCKRPANHEGGLCGEHGHIASGNHRSWGKKASAVDEAASGENDRLMRKKVFIKDRDASRPQSERRTKRTFRYWLINPHKPAQKRVR
ncbi:uncharacterized protein K452DRAFT_307336 [Aplosporella prunicola CBS 121167]|uniref:Uncharacterized protein n=1 Tax=Aplosporella prunicola CBS 121167 TaxID=1176127 RepID=A0A6A6BK12_9PEZI|nr:uncharacterized protein K452DRAFT_307336 [Aplosporella prunicola CBS 121167]KAF2143157.1 hypothetical protein K452DRAFT_307336 [Aplosporella prunicola CBS 121167]